MKRYEQVKDLLVIFLWFYLSVIGKGACELFGLGFAAGRGALLPLDIDAQQRHRYCHEERNNAHEDVATGFVRDHKGTVDGVGVAHFAEADKAVKGENSQADKSRAESRQRNDTAAKLSYLSALDPVFNDHN